MQDRLSQLGSDLIARALAALARDSLMFHPQSEAGVTYAHKISKEECRIDWSPPAHEVHNHIRGLSPSPGAFFDADFGRGMERIKVLRSSPVEGSGSPGTLLDDHLTFACGSGAVRLLNVQRAGKAPMDAASFVRGCAPPSSRSSQLMQRYKLTIEYDGSPFVGWQRQANGLSVQEAIEAAVERITGERRVVYGAGRTDAGVHARGQVAHLDLMREWRGDRLRDALNAHLKPAPVAIFRQRRSARLSRRGSRRLPAIMFTASSTVAPRRLERDHVWHVARRLDARDMHAAAQCLVGKHDFSTFRAAECQANSPVRTLDKLEVVRTGDLVEVHASARSFLHHQVRSIVGSLEHVGSGKWSDTELNAALHACDRARCGPVAPGGGLFLVRVDY